MKYSVVQVADGQCAIAREGLTTKKQAMVNYHQVCADLWNDADTSRAEVRLIDENFVFIANESIEKEEPAPEPEETTEG